jgi:tripartite-type tricarboxylate transporter receptor subunit TctC
VQSHSEFLYAGQGIGRPFFAPPGLAPDVYRMMRTAFDATMRNPEFVAEARQRNLTLAPENGEYMQRLIERIYVTPRPVVERVAALIK